MRHTGETPGFSADRHAGIRQGKKQEKGVELGNSPWEPRC